MGDKGAYHRPLMPGIKIWTKTPRTNGTDGTDDVRDGTLTGLATRNSDGKDVLVTISN